MLKELKYRPVIKSGILTAMHKGSIVLEGEDNVVGFDTVKEASTYMKVRKIPVLEYCDVLDETGALDESKVAAFYVEHYARLEAIAIPFEAGLTLKTSHPYPISYDGKLYECIQGHTTQADWTPDVVPALFSEIQAPGASGYPAWVPPTSTVYYNKGDRMTYTDGLNYESLIDNNVWSPEVYPAGWKVI